MSAALVIALGLIGAPPSPPASPPAPTSASPHALAQSPARLEAAGKVREVSGGIGGQADVILQLDDKSELVLHGRDPADDDELHRLAGVRVKIDGLTGDPLLPPGNHVRVIKYEILDVGRGAPPRVGTMAQLLLDGKPRLLFVDDRGRAELLPAQWLPKMERLVGAKMWIVGSSSGADLTPSRYGVLRPGPKAGPGE